MKKREYDKKIIIKEVTQSNFKVPDCILNLIANRDDDSIIIRYMNYVFWICLIILLLCLTFIFKTNSKDYLKVIIIISPIVGAILGFWIGPWFLKK